MLMTRKYSLVYIYGKYLLILPGSEFWDPPSNWTSGDRPAIYRSFNDDRDIELINGAQIISSKVRYIVFRLW